MTNQSNIPAHSEYSGASNNLPSTDFIGSIPGKNEEKIHLIEYIEILMRRKWILFGFLFLTFISTMIFSLAAEKQYLASGTIEVSPDAQKVTKFEDVINQRGRVQEFITTQVTLLRSNTLAIKVIDSLNMPEHPFFIDDQKSKNPGLIGLLKALIQRFSKQDENKSNDQIFIDGLLEEKKMLSYFKNNLTVSPQRESMIITISFISPSRELSQTVVNELMNQYINWQMEQKVDSSAKAREYLMKQIDRSKIHLERAENQQHDFARQAGIVSLDSRLNTVYRQLEDINTALGQAESDLIIKETRYKQALEDGPDSLPQVLNSQLINNLKSEYARQHSEYENLRETFHEDYPEVRRVKRRMASSEERIDGESQKIFNSIAHEYKTAKSRVELLRKRMEHNKQLALELNERATQYNIMTREVEINKAIYQSLLERAKEIETMAGVSPSNSRIVDKASLPIFPDKPNIRHNLMLAIVLGLIGGLGVAFLMEYLADTITNPDQISDRFQIPILAIIPIEKASQDYEIERIYTSAPRAVMSEALRTCRVSIQLSGEERNAKCIAITSTNPGEGKTTIAANLAQAFAGTGERVLIIDADLRKPRMHEVFPVASATNNSNGLSSFLAGVISSDFIAKTSIDNIHLIPSGPVPPNPVELLASNRFSRLIKSSMKAYDRIIIDAPPFYGFADTLVLSRQVGGIILVSSIGETTRNGLRQFKSAMNNVKATVLGCIVNKVNLHPQYGYRSYYKYYKASEYDEIKHQSVETYKLNK